MALPHCSLLCPAVHWQMPQPPPHSSPGTSRLPRGVSSGLPCHSSRAVACCLLLRTTRKELKTTGQLAGQTHAPTQRPHADVSGDSVPLAPSLRCSTGSLCPASWAGPFLEEAGQAAGQVWPRDSQVLLTWGGRGTGESRRWAGQGPNGQKALGFGGARAPPH